MTAMDRIGLQYFRMVVALEEMADRLSQAQDRIKQLEGEPSEPVVDDVSGAVIAKAG